MSYGGGLSRNEQKLVNKRLKQKNKEGTQLFKKYDADGNGLDREELAALFDELEVQITVDELEEGFKKINADGNENIDLKEFHVWWDAARSRDEVELRRAMAKTGHDDDDNEGDGIDMDGEKQKKLHVPNVDRAGMNRLLQKAVFGSSVETGLGDAEAARQSHLKREWCGLLHPDTPVRALYDFLQLSILLYLAWVLPNRIAFSKSPKGWDVFTDLLIDMLVWVDMLLGTPSHGEPCC